METMHTHETHINNNVLAILEDTCLIWSIYLLSPSVYVYDLIAPLLSNYLPCSLRPDARKGWEEEDGEN